MTATRKIKLIRVTDGLYRVDSPDLVTISRQSRGRGRQGHDWRILSRNGAGTIVARRFSTLAECRRHLEKN